MIRGTSHAHKASVNIDPKRRDVINCSQNNNWEFWQKRANYLFATPGK